MDLPASMRHAIPPPPLEYIHPVMALHGSITYDRPLDNYFDAAMARRPVLVRRPGNLYDTVANAHDTHFQFGPGMFNGSNPTDRCKCPPIGRERWCQRAAHCGSPPDYPSLGWEYPGWRPRRSSYEDRRGAVSVTLAEICSMSPFPTSSECENATAVYPSDGEHLHGLDDHSSDVADAMDFERASDDTFDTSNTNIALSGPRQLPPDCSPVLDFEPHDVFRITCTEAVTKGVDHPEWNIPWVSEARPACWKMPQIGSFQKRTSLVPSPLAPRLLQCRLRPCRVLGTS
ncbi:hypothetical protein EDC04DRAFT_1617953 [Pisolithus marmoratus]|nr:hypothetical protein EDC04DRAFT_1617953 [Pisolithus marmoratus]